MGEKCGYPGCEVPEKYILDENVKCMFHQSKEKTGIGASKLNQSLIDYLLEGHTNCRYFIFHESVNLGGIGSLDSVDFERAKFHGSADFKGITSLSSVSFRGAKFYLWTNFEGIEFTGDTNFGFTEFIGSVSFSNCRFINGSHDFGFVKFKGGYTSFKGVEFLGDTNFELAEFDVRVDFDNSHFINGSYNFSSAKFRRIARFSEVEFTGRVDFRFVEFNESAEFGGCHFVNGIYDFSYATFKGRTTNFSNTTFKRDEDYNEKCEVLFGLCTFDNENVQFQNTKFLCDRTAFNGSHFNCRLLLFNTAEFSVGAIDFSVCHFSGRTYFYDNPICEGIAFSDISFDSQSQFIFGNPIFVRKKRMMPIILFERALFNPFNTYFENIGLGDNFENILDPQNPLLVFRDCGMKNVYFKQNNMSLVSLYNNAYFEEITTVSCIWEPGNDKLLGFMPYRRLYLSMEEIDYDAEESKAESFPNQEKEKPGENRISWPETYKDLSEIYLRFKTSADRAKDYHLASWFYFNEIEMKRRHILKEIRDIKSKTKRVVKRVRSLKLWQYNLYKIFAGYGEKPGWSLWWFGIFTALFSILHLHLGFKTPGGIPIKYKWTWDWSNTGQFIIDTVHSVLFTWSNAIPYVFASFRDHKYQLLTHSGLDVGLLILNTISLALMLIFTGIGLKRHFRRF